MKKIVRTGIVSLALGLSLSVAAQDIVKDCEAAKSICVLSHKSGCEAKYERCVADQKTAAGFGAGNKPCLAAGFAEDTPCTSSEDAKIALGGMGADNKPCGYVGWKEGETCVSDIKGEEISRGGFGAGNKPCLAAGFAEDTPCPKPEGDPISAGFGSGAVEEVPGPGLFNCGFVDAKVDPTKNNPCISEAGGI